MLIILENFNQELKDYLLSQEGINNVDYIEKDNYEVNIDFDDRINPILIMKYINLFFKCKTSIIIGFNKNNNKNVKKIKYTVDDICCEYCYKGLVQNLFDNENIISVKSDYNIKNPSFKVDLFIEYDDSYSEQELIDFIKKSI